LYIVNIFKMEKFFLDKTSSSPEISLDPISGICEIAGVSMPEDVKIIYNPLLNWLDEFGKNNTNAIIFNFKFIYFNTASAKIILDILLRLDGLSKLGKKVTINWHYKEVDLDMEEAVEDYADMISIPINKIKI
jgi:hypothetical protein